MADLTPEVIDLANRNLPVMVRNFKKIGDWFKNGKASENPLPPAIQAFLTDYDATKEQLQQTTDKLTTVTNDFEKKLKDLDDLFNAQESAYQLHIEKLQKQIADLSDKLAPVDTAPQTTEQVTPPADEAKPKKRLKKAETAEPATDDVVALTAAAVDAGDVSPKGLDAIDKMIDGLLPNNPPSDTAQADMDDF